MRSFANIDISGNLFIRGNDFHTTVWNSLSGLQGINFDRSSGNIKADQNIAINET